MGPITGILTIKPAWNKQKKNRSFRHAPKHNLRNNKNIVKKIEIKIKNLEQRFRVCQTNI